MIIHYYKPPYKDYHIAAFHSPVENERELGRWCYDNFGPSGYQPDIAQVRWNDNIHYGEIRFDRESDLALFLLRWS
jgi:hypothetical protein